MGEEVRRWRVVSTSPSFGLPFPEPVDYLDEHGCDVQLLAGAPVDEQQAAIAAADAWIVGFEPADATTLERAPGIRVVAKCGVGIDNFDLPYLEQRGVAVVSVPGGNAKAVAEFVMAQMLALYRQVRENDAAVRAGRWAPSLSASLEGRVLGIVGFGAIGQRLAAYAQALGMEVVASDPYAPAHKLGNVTLLSLDELLSRADVVSVHVPLTPETRNLIGAPQLSQMKPGALLINNSRGGTVDEAAAAAALNSGHLGGGAFDVFAQEPLPDDSPLRSSPNTLLSSHVAGGTDRARQYVTMTCAEKVAAALTATGPATVCENKDLVS